MALDGIKGLFSVSNSVSKFTKGINNLENALKVFCSIGKGTATLSRTIEGTISAVGAAAKGMAVSAVAVGRIIESGSGIYNEIISKSTENSQGVIGANESQVEEVNKVKDPKTDLKNSEHPHDYTKGGNYGEMTVDIDLESTGRYSRISDDRVTSLDDQTHHGIDGVYRNSNPPPEYVIVDAKYLSADSATNTNKAPSLNNTKSGRQLSDKWIAKNIDNAVDYNVAKHIKHDIKFNTGNTERVVAKVDNTGNVTYYKVNSEGKVIKNSDGTPNIWIP